MSELTECYADQAAINERYRTAHRDMAALRQRVAVLEEALTNLRDATKHNATVPMHLISAANTALATTEGE